MTAISLPTKASSRLGAWAPLATCCLVLLLPALWLLVQGDVADPDVWWHLRTGRWMVEHRAVPATDCFSQYGQGKPWVAYSWLAELLLYGLCQAFGIFGLRIFLATMALAILAALYAMLRRLQPNHRLTAMMTLVAAIGMFTLFSPRPWLLSILFFIIELDLLLTASRSGNRRLLWWLLPLFALWANVHIQCMTGLAFLGLAAVEPLLARLLPKGYASPDARRLPPGWLLGIFVLSAAAVLVNPYHFRLYLVAMELLSQTALWNRIAELLAMPFRTWSNWAVLAVALAAAVAIGRARQIRPLLPLALAAAIYFGFRSQRDAWMVLVTGLATLASLSAPQIAAGADTSPKRKRGLLHAPSLALRASADCLVSDFPSCSRREERHDLIAALIILIALAVGIACFHRQSLSGEIAEGFPVRAADFIARERLAGPMYNLFDWGGYLMYALPEIPVGIDGRTAVHGQERVLRNWATVYCRRGWQDDPELARARLVVLPKDCPLSALLAHDARFRRVYRDEVAAVFVGRLAEAERKDGRRQEEQAGVEQRQAVVADVREAVGEHPEKDRAAGGHDAADVVTKAGAGGPQQRGEQRRQVHREQPKNPLASADHADPQEKHGEGLVGVVHAVGERHGQAVGQAE
jgi:hypothetical protein